MLALIDRRLVWDAGDLRKSGVLSEGLPSYLMTGVSALLAAIAYSLVQESS